MPPEGNAVDVLGGKAHGTSSRLVSDLRFGCFIRLFLLDLLSLANRTQKRYHLPLTKQLTALIP